MNDNRKGNVKLLRHGMETKVRILNDPARRDIICSDPQEVLLVLHQLRAEGLSVPNALFRRMEKKLAAINEALKP